ncbi:MAG: bifunctional oligoribonuclease/PAP phosphatase NrnA [Clostridia bacterium]|nr:bifunctional oligoribonuclease/PAP phosphatase NrnA [Clostridia bacterium]
MEKLQDIKAALESAQRVAVFTHTNPDGDALGSSYAIKAILEALGKQVVLFLETDLPERFSYLNDGYSLSGESADFDTALALDCGSLNRLGRLQDLYLAIPKRLVLDHHYADVPFGDVYFTDPGAAACAELVYELAHMLCPKLPQKAVVALYTGISTDTGHFKYSNVTAKTFTIAADLISCGLNQREITRHLYDTVKLNKLKFTGAVAERVRLHEEGRVAVLFCTDSFLAGYNLAHDEVEELPNTILSIEGVEVSVLVKEKEPGKLKISLRCKENINVAHLASAFGGGGHACAAGFVTELSFEEIEKELVQQIVKRLEEQNG